MASVHSVLATPTRGCPIGSSTLTHAILDSFKIPDPQQGRHRASLRPGFDLEDVHSATSAAPRPRHRRRGRRPPDRSDNGAQGGSRPRHGAGDGAPCAAWFIGVVASGKLTNHGRSPLARLKKVRFDPVSGPSGSYHQTADLLRAPLFEATTPSSESEQKTLRSRKRFCP